MTNVENRPIDIHKYDDIINLPHPDSTEYARMSMANRAAQFLPFAALTGYDDAVEEASRLTKEKVELDENRKEILNNKLLFLEEHSSENPEATITYFVPDERKDGGEYQSITGKYKKTDPYMHTVFLQNGIKIRLDDIFDIQIPSFFAESVRE